MRAAGIALAGALMTFTPASPAHAQSDALVLRVPECAADHVDVALLRELVAIELADARPLEIELAETLCDLATPRLDLDVRDPETGREAHEQIALARDAEPDARAAARAVALAIAERAPRILAVLEDPGPTASPPPEPDPPPDPDPVPIRDPAPEPEPARALAPPFGDTASAAPPPLGPTLGIGVRGRIAPALPSWALGLRADVGAHFDATWSLRAELFATWTRATPIEGDVDAVVVAGAAVLGASVYRDASLELVLGGRAEVGALASFGWRSATSTGPPTLHPWIDAGAELDLALALGAGVALVFDLALTGVVYGTRIVTWPSGTQIDLSLVTIDLGAGIRLPL